MRSAICLVRRISVWNNLGGSQLPAWGHFGESRKRRGQLFELLKAILALLMTVLRPEKQATANVSGTGRGLNAFRQGPGGFVHVWSYGLPWVSHGGGAMVQHT